MGQTEEALRDEKAFRIQVGSLIRRLRRAATMSQEDLADMAGLHPNYIGLVERGQRMATVGAARRIVRALGLTLSQFFADMGE